MDGYKRTSRFMVFMIVLAVVMAGVALGYSVLSRASDTISLRNDEAKYEELFESSVEERLEELMDEYDSAVIIKDENGEISEGLFFSDDADLKLAGIDKLYFGSDTLADSSLGSSSASLLGVFDEFENSDAQTVQEVLKDLDEAISDLGVLSSATPAPATETQEEAEDEVAEQTVIIEEFEEKDPVFSQSAAAGVSDGDISHWDSAYGWGNHAAAGYLSSESDPVWDAAKGSYLRSDASDTYASGNTLTFAGGADFDGSVTISTTEIIMDALGYTTLRATGDMRVSAGGDLDDYLYFSTASDVAGLYWAGYTATNDPGIRVNSGSNKLEFRDEDESTWTELDGLGGGGSTDMITSVRSTTGVTYTENGVWVDISDMEVPITMTETGDVFAEFTCYISGASANWEIFRLRFSLDDSTYSELYHKYRQSAPENSEIYIVTIHTVFSDVSAGEHTIKTQWDDGGSSLDISIGYRRLTVIKE